MHTWIGRSGCTYVCLFQGEPVDLDQVVASGGDSLRPENVCWVSVGGDIEGCIRSDSGEYKELTIKWCQMIWPNLKTKEIGGNEQIVTNTEGKTVIVPVIPYKFVLHKEKKQRKSKVNRKRKKNAPQPEGAHTDTGAILERLDVLDDYCVDLLHIPGRVVATDFRSTPDIWDTLRKAQMSGSYPQILESVQSADDLERHAHFPVIMSVFNYFFPTRP